MIKNFHQRRIIAHRIPRCAKFSTPANNALPTLTPEEIAIEEKKIAAHKKFIRHSCKFIIWVFSSWTRVNSYSFLSFQISRQSWKLSVL